MGSRVPVWDYWGLYGVWEHSQVPPRCVLLPRSRGSAGRCRLPKHSGIKSPGAGSSVPRVCGAAAGRLLFFFCSWDHLGRPGAARACPTQPRGPEEQRLWERRGLRASRGQAGFLLRSETSLWPLGTSRAGAGQGPGVFLLTGFNGAGKSSWCWAGCGCSVSEDKSVEITS